MILQNPTKTTAVNFGFGFEETLGVRVKGDVFGVLQYEDGREEIVLDKSMSILLVVSCAILSKNLGAGFVGY